MDAVQPVPVLLIPAGEATWRDLARCAEVGGDFWFPEKGGSARRAKAVCRSCEVRAECLQWALDHDEEHGIWGGMSTEERHRLAGQRAPRMCRSGLHLMDEANTYVYPNRWKTCRACKDAREQERQQRRGERAA